MHRDDMTDHEAAEILEALDRSEQWLSNTNSLALRAGAAALREVERLREAVSLAYTVHQTVRAGKDFAKRFHLTVDQYGERLRAALDNSPTPDPRDTRIAELKEALRVAKIHGEAIASASWNAGQSGGKPEWMIADFSARKTFNNAIDAALKEAK